MDSNILKKYGVEDFLKKEIILEIERIIKDNYEVRLFLEKKIKILINKSVNKKEIIEEIKSVKKSQYKSIFSYIKKEAEKTKKDMFSNIKSFYEIETDNINELKIETIIRKIFFSKEFLDEFKNNLYKK